MLNHDRLVRILDELEDLCKEAQDELGLKPKVKEAVFVKDFRDKALLVCLRALYVLYEDWLHTRPFN